MRRRAVAVDGDGLVHLSDGGGRDRRAELGEVVLEPAAERLLDRGPRFALRERRQAVLQGAEVALQLGPDQIAARRQELAELDVGRPERRDGT